MDASLTTPNRKRMNTGVAFKVAGYLERSTSDLRQEVRYGNRRRGEGQGNHM